MILINLPMPKSCEDCKFCSKSLITSGKCVITSDSANFKKRPRNCPLIDMHPKKEVESEPEKETIPAGLTDEDIVKRLMSGSYSDVEEVLKELEKTGLTEDEALDRAIKSLMGMSFPTSSHFRVGFTERFWHGDHDVDGDTYDRLSF